MRTNWDEPPGPEEPRPAPAVAELRLCESAPIPEVNVYLSGPIEEATLRIVVVQERPGRMARLLVGCLTAIAVTFLALRIVHVWSGR